MTSPQEKLARSERYKSRYRADRSIYESKVEWRKNNREYAVWREMIQRCTDQNHVQYQDYGGRGIAVCVRWLNEDGYKNFLADMGKRPSPKHMLDRENNNLGYFPENCRWVNRITQNRNTRKNLVIEFDGEKRCLAEWSEKLGMKYRVLYSRIVTYGWSVEKAFTTPEV